MNNLDEEDADAWHKMSEKLIGEFTKIANLGMSEYEYMPPNKYFRDSAQKEVSGCFNNFCNSASVYGSFSVSSSFIREIGNASRYS